MKSRKTSKRIRVTKHAKLFACIFITFILTSCVFDNWNNDLGDFVDKGTSLTKLVSFSYIQDGKSADADVARGLPVTVNMKVLNPKALDIAYTLSYDPALVVEGSLIPIPNSAGADDGYTKTSFTFTPTALADHGDIGFTLGLRSPSINKEFKNGTLSVHCDSPPDPVNNLVAGVRSDGRACIGFALPEDYPNADISAVRITYTSATIGSNITVTEDVSISGTNLTAVPNPALLGTATGKYLRYFLPDDVVAGNPYTFTVVTIDESEKESIVPSDPASVSVTGTEVYLAFDPNGATGSVGAKFGFNTETTVIPGATDLTYDNHVFMSWNTAANGSGTTYMPNDAYTFTTSNTTLYAQWIELAGIQVSILNPSFRTLGFTKNGYAITSTVIDINGTLNLSFASGIGGTNFQWYQDGVAIVPATTAAYSFDPVTSGTWVISVAALVDGVSYSGNLTVTVTDEYMITILPEGQMATYDQTTWTNNITLTTTFPHTITRAYKLGRYEVSFQLWTDVRNWAAIATPGYTDLRGGAQGYGTDPTTGEHPVTRIADLDAMIWCNAYSEMTGAKPCYYADTAHTIVLRSTATLNGIANYSHEYVDWSANGYRLPTYGEWHYAASCGGYYAYDHVSGCSTQPYNNVAASLPYANVATDVSNPVNIKTPNIWGLYNMSGNVWEYSFDLYQVTSPNTPQTNYVSDSGPSRVTGGSSCRIAHDRSRSSVGYKASTTINNDNAFDDGFRLARSIP